MTLAYVAVGANLGEPRTTIAAALQALAAVPRVRVAALSHWYRTEPVASSGPDYTNGALAVQTGWSARELLAALLAIEAAFGRVRPEGVLNAPRTLDLDLLTFGSERCSSPVLTLPHPRMHLRRFVLEPLADIAPDLEIASFGTVRDLLSGTAVQAQRCTRLPWQIQLQNYA